MGYNQDYNTQATVTQTTISHKWHIEATYKVHRRWAQWLINLEIPVLVLSLKLSNVELG